MFRFFWLTILANLGLEATEVFTNLNFDENQTITALGIAGFLKILESRQNKSKNEVKKEEKKETPKPEETLEGHLLHRYQGLKEIAEQERLSLNGLIISCTRTEKLDNTIYDLFYENRPEPFIRLVYEVRTNDVIIGKMSYLRKTEGIADIMNKIINKVYFIEKDSRGIEPPRDLSLYEEQEKTLEIFVSDNETLTDEIEIKGRELIKELQSLSSNEQYLDIVEVHKLSNTYIDDVQKTLQLYRSFDNDMKQKSKQQFVIVLEQIGSYMEKIKEAAQNRQENELKRLLNLIENRDS